MRSMSASPFSKRTGVRIRTHRATAAGPRRDPFSNQNRTQFARCPALFEPGPAIVRGSSGWLTVGFGAMPYGVDDEGVVGFFGEADAVVADAEPEFFGVALQLLDVSLA